MTCPFCGSKEIKVELPYIDRITGKPTTGFCCRNQARNADYAKKRYDPIYGEKPDPEEISKL